MNWFWIALMYRAWPPSVKTRDSDFFFFQNVSACLNCHFMQASVRWWLIFALSYSTLKKKCQNHGQNLHSSCKVNFRFEPKIDLLPNDLMIHHENSRRRVSGSIHLLFKPFLDVLLDYYDMNVWRIPKQILDGKVEYHNIILFFRKLNFSQILAHTIYADFQYIYSRASNWTQDSQCTNLGRGKFEAWI